MKEKEELKDLSGRSFEIDRLLDYQNGAVVSRTLIDRETGTLSLFALDKGQTISEHTTPYDALVVIMDGKAKITISGEEIKLEAGESTLMPANEPHALEAVEKFKMLLVMIR